LLISVYRKPCASINPSPSSRSTISHSTQYTSPSLGWLVGDAEQVIILRAKEEKSCLIEATGSLDQDDVVHCVTDIMEGGREAIQYRITIYQRHWTGAVDTH